MNIARARGLAEALVDPLYVAATEEGAAVQISAAAVGREILAALDVPPCPICGETLGEARTRISGVCPTHGVRTLDA